MPHKTADVELTDACRQVIDKHVERAKRKGDSDTVMLRGCINECRTRARKVPLERISQSQFRKIMKKYKRNAPGNRKAAIVKAVKSGLRKTKSASA
jgi:hypothetical protein